MRTFVKLQVVMLGALLSRAFAHGSAQEVGDKWATNLGNAQASMTAGVNRVQESPGARAVAARQRWVAAMTSQATHEKWTRNVGAVSLQSWKDSMTKIGIQRAAQGANDKKEKMVAAMTHLLPFVDNLRSQIAGMPNVTENDREQRAIAWMRGMRQYQRGA